MTPILLLAIALLAYQVWKRHGKVEDVEVRD